ncbi:MAG: hypothetical protein L0Y70_09470, partial [Gemmataceae bacterium]|nr:hypothetical protein [Gemmataceae bacterium]
MAATWQSRTSAQGLESLAGGADRASISGAACSRLRLLNLFDDGFEQLCLDEQGRTVRQGTQQVEDLSLRPLLSPQGTHDDANRSVNLVLQALG